MLNIIFAGSNEVSLDSLIACSKVTNILKVYTNPDKPHKRSKKLIPTPVKTWCLEQGIAVSDITPNSEEFIDQIKELNPDLGIAVSYSHILKAPALNAIPNGWINLHFSLLPSYRGAAPIQRAIINGETETGVTIFKLDSGVDTGEILAQEPVELLPDENASEALTRISKLGAEFLKNYLINRMVPTPTRPPVKLSINFSVPDMKFQNLNNFSPDYAQKLTKTEGEIPLDKTPVEVVNHIRGFTYNPGAWLMFRGKKLIISKARVTQPEIAASTSSPVREAHRNDEIGEIVFSKTTVTLKLVSGNIELLEVKPEGKNFMKAVDWARGLH
jgi:methionyl-tRNA formyltransferase